MNTLVAASLFDNPWVLVVIVLVGALSQWLMKRRQADHADNRPASDEPLPPPGQPQEHSPRELDLQEALRQLLDGEPPPRAPHPPPIPPVMREAQPSEGWSDEVPFRPEPAWMDEPQETDEVARLPATQTAPPSRPHFALVRASAPRRFEQLSEQGRYPAPVINHGRVRRSREGARAIGLLRDHRTVRQAFVASLVFGLPKAFEK